MPQPIAILAHPGHELRLFAWMERERPLVCILTDGSGGVAASRTAYSEGLLRGCGASAGQMMGTLPDRAWYAAILAGDADPFLRAAESIAGAAEPGALVVADPVEGYNPMHDLCAAVADRVAALIGGRRATYPLMRPRHEGEVLRLDPATAQRKRAAVTLYAPLAEEAAVLLAADPRALAEEWILADRFDWPEAMVPPPAYEAIGAARQAAGVYGETIGYQRHVRPMALRLRER